MERRLREVFKAKRFVRVLAAASARYDAAQAAKSKGMYSEIDGRIRDLQAQMERFLDAIAQGIPVSVIGPRLDHVRGALEQAQGERSRLVSTPPPSFDWVVDLVRSLEDGGDVRTILLALAEKLEMSREAVVVRFRLPLQPLTVCLPGGRFRWDANTCLGTGS